MYVYGVAGNVEKRLLNDEQSPSSLIMNVRIWTALLQKVHCNFLLQEEVSLHLVLYLWITLMELELLNIDSNALLTPFMFTYCGRTVCYFDTSLLREF